VDVLRHWLATSSRYSVDPRDARVLLTEDEAKSDRERGWRVNGPYVEAAHYERAVEALREIAELTDVPADFPNARVRLRWVHKRASDAVGGGS
jgi:hypothetical protein